MRARAASAFGTVRLVVDAVRDDRITFLAAGVAYYAFVSLIPALLLLVVVAGTLFDDVIAARLLAVTGGFLTPAGEAAISEAVLAADGRAGAGVVGLVVLLWSTLKVFRGLDTAFLEVYGVEQEVTFLDQLTDAASVVAAIGIGMAAMVVVGAAVATLNLPGVKAAGVFALPVLLTVVFLPMYYLLPYPAASPREALPGAVVAAVGWTVLQAVFQAYAAGAAGYEVYGVIGGVLLLVTWLYAAAIVVMVGAVLNVVLAGEPDDDTWVTGETNRTGAGNSDRQLQHDRGRPSGMDGEAESGSEEERPRGAPDVAALEEEVDRLQAKLDAFEEDVERRTVDKPAVESELKRYVRSRMRRGHARGWGPYLVLLYGTVLILGSFAFLDGIYAIAGMFVLGLSTLGLYALFIIVGVGLNLIGAPGKALDYARRRGDD